jgi:3-isopropylmalate/(R)-2-methylmalate dehydratase small subunit
MGASSVTRIEGRAVPVRGNDIDTDRIIPARYLRSVTFDGLGEHAFEDDRKAGGHPFDDPRFQGASILVVNRNFGCGSSREHAPQSLMRWGIRAVVGESFAEIFRGNCTAMGIPCVTAEGAEVLLLMEAVEAEPGQAVAVDLRTKTVTYGDKVVRVQMPDSARSQLLEGAWDATGQLLEGAEAVRATAARLPYVTGFK